ncbi:MAG: HepT-like ribonuclease domain-containing protein [Pseudomonadota bacterium]
MPKRDDTVVLRHMLDHAREAVGMIAGKTRKDLDAERMLELSLTRLVEIVGEAAGRVSVQGQEEHPAIPWKEIIGMRNRLIHGYDSVDLDVLWDTVDLDLPPLIIALEKIEMPSIDP